MIRSAVLVLLFALPAFAQEADGGTVVSEDAPRKPVVESEQKPAAELPKTDTTLDRYRTPMEALTERMIGSASKSVRYDWRNAQVGFGVVGSELLERNNFGSAGLGGFVRKPFSGLMGELAVTRVWTWGTDSSQKLALTPYRQYGRPSRFELDVNLSYPLAEGVVTSMPSFFPAAQLVFSVTGGFRYLYYPGELSGAKFADVAKALLNPRLTDREYNNLESAREPGMAIDSGRYGIMGGLTLDVYFQPGFFITPRALIHVPVLAPATGTHLGLWYELSLGIGWMI